jgi:uridine kinase
LDVKSLVLNQDNYFYLAPALNDAKRKSDPNWLGPHAEVNMDLMEQNLTDALAGAGEIEVPFIDYHSNTQIFQKFSLSGIDTIIAEGTYVSLLRQVNTRLFITSTYVDTLPYRILRNRGNEVNDPFVENILKTEHKIIAGHRFLADFLITPGYQVIKKGKK